MYQKQLPGNEYTGESHRFCSEYTGEPWNHGVFTVVPASEVAAKRLLVPKTPGSQVSQLTNFCRLPGVFITQKSRLLCFMIPQ
jgi:hypothetical protein